MTGRMMGERLGRWNFWVMFIGMNVTFFPMHIVGLRGMPRRDLHLSGRPGVGSAESDRDRRRHTCSRSACCSS